MLRKIEERLRSAKAFIFDFYGTLVEDDTAVPEMWESLSKLGYNSSPELQAIFEPNSFDGCVTPTFSSRPSHNDWIQSNWRQFIELSGVPGHMLDCTLLELLEEQRRFRAKSIPCASHILTFLRTHDRRIGLCSNWESPIHPFLEETGLPEFDAISISAEIGARKPHRRIFNDICSKLQVDPAQAVFIGDNWTSDMVGALRFGLTPVWIRCGRQTRNLPQLVAEFDTLKEFAMYLESVGLDSDIPATARGCSPDEKALGKELPL
jgi:HAD superfamily hydrolase (TIGR01549 family)